MKYFNFLIFSWVLLNIQLSFAQDTLTSQTANHGDQYILYSDGSFDYCYYTFSDSIPKKLECTGTYVRNKRKIKVHFDLSKCDESAFNETVTFKKHDNEYRNYFVLKILSGRKVQRRKSYISYILE